LEPTGSISALSAVEPLIETEEFTAEELRELCRKANALNSYLTPEEIKVVIRNPMKAVKAIINKLVSLSCHEKKSQKFRFFY